MRCFGVGPIGQADSEVFREDGPGAGEDGRVRVPVLENRDTWEQWEWARKRGLARCGTQSIDGI